MEELNQIENMIEALRRLRASIKKKDKLSEKLFNMDYRNHTPKRIQSVNADLNWECMNIDKEKTNFARIFKGSCIDVGIEEKQYNPSGFHSYKH